MREDAFAKTMRHPLESKFVHEGRSPPAHLFGGWRLVDQEVRGALKTNFSTSDHDVTPWLAGLFVVPEYRRWGAGAVLVPAIEDQARQRGFAVVPLHHCGVGFYARLGWSVLDRTHWKGSDAALIVCKCQKRQGEGAAATANGQCAQDCDARKQLVQGHDICGA